jgi:hypothetical protein
MKGAFRAFAASGVLLAELAGGDTALAQKQGGILRVYHRDSPASMSIHEEGTVWREMDSNDRYRGNRNGPSRRAVSARASVRREGFDVYAQPNCLPYRRDS